MSALGTFAAEFIGAVGVLAVGALAKYVRDDLRKTQQVYEILTGRESVDSDDGLIARVDSLETKLDGTAREVAQLQRRIGGRDR